MWGMIKMVLVLTVLSAVSGGLLSFLDQKTKPIIFKTELELVKGPVVKAMLADASNQPLEDNFTTALGGKTATVFVGVYDGEPKTIVFETFGNGYGGPVGVMIEVNVNDDTITEVGITTHTETLGLDAEGKTDPAFIAQFEGLSLLEPVQVTADGGSINALSGATITSKAICTAITRAGEVYPEAKPQIEEELKAFAK
jgi:electron transport complex protein RnfG